jgi:hypothetical protein
MFVLSNEDIAERILGGGDHLELSNCLAHQARREMSSLADPIYYFTADEGGYTVTIFLLLELGGN